LGCFVSWISLEEVFWTEHSEETVSSVEHHEERDELPEDLEEKREPPVDGSEWMPTGSRRITHVGWIMPKPRAGVISGRVDPRIVNGYNGYPGRIGLDLLAGDGDVSVAGGSPNRIPATAVVEDDRCASFVVTEFDSERGL